MTDLALNHAQEAHGPPAAEPSTDPAHATAAALAEHFGGLEIVDDGLELEGGVRVEHVGRDAAGNLCLILMLSGRGSSSLAATLDLVAFARSHRSVLRRVYHVDGDALIRVVIVAEHYDGDLRRRLEALEPCGVELVRLGALRTARGERLFALALNEPAAPDASIGSAAPPAAPEQDLETLLSRVEPRLANNLRLCVRRLERIDETLDLRIARDGLAWFQGKDLLARIELREEGQAVGVVPGRGPRSLGGRHGVELFVDEAVAAFVERSQTDDATVELD